MGSTPVASLPPAFSWHPKITPYRLSVIVTTSALGITKAILVAYGEVSSSITVEWITGVVMALSFQFLDTYEYKIQRSANLNWFFTYDCLHIVKKLGPASTSQPHHTGDIDSSSEPPSIVTAYRILVSTIVCVFGVLKMFCGYLGLSVTMNTFDWMVAVPLTLGLYYIGLYEEMESSIPRKFFDIEYSSGATVSLLTGLYFPTGIIVCLLWFSGWVIIFTGPLPKSSFVPNGKDVREAISDRALEVMFIVFYLAMLELGAWGLSYFLWPMTQAWTGRYAGRIRRYIDRFATIIGYLLASSYFAALSVFLFCYAIQFFNEDDAPLIGRIITGGFMLSVIPATLTTALLCIYLPVFL